MSTQQTKTLGSRIQCKYDTPENWAKVPNQSFMPLKGELIIYANDENNAAPRFKVGDGVTFIEGLPFSDKSLEDYMPIAGGNFSGAISAPEITTSGLDAGEILTNNISVENGITTVSLTASGEVTAVSLKVSDKAQILPISGGLKLANPSNNNSIVLRNVADPTTATDAANKNFVEQQCAENKNYTNDQIATLQDYVDQQDDILQEYVDALIYQGTEVPTDTNMLWIDTDDNSETGGSGSTDSGVVGDYLPLAGGTMSGTINMNGNKISNLVAPTADSDAATKKYVEEYVSANGGGNSGAGSLTQVFHAGTLAPSNTNLLWIDTNTSSGGLKYYNGSSWTVVPVAYV